MQGDGLGLAMIFEHTPGPESTDVLSGLDISILKEFLSLKVLVIYAIKVTVVLIEVQGPLFHKLFIVQFIRLFREVRLQVLLITFTSLRHLLCVLSLELPLLGLPRLLRDNI